MIVCSSQKEVEELHEFHLFSRNTGALSPFVRSQIAFLRVWCLVEIHAAVTSDAVIVMKTGSQQREDDVIRFESDPRMGSKMISLIDIASAEATVPSDKERILNLIETSTEGGVDAINRIIRGVMTGACCTVKYPEVQCAACGDQEALNTVLAVPAKYVFAASGCGYTELLRTLLESGGTPNSVESGLPLDVAALGGYMECVELLLKHGADIHARAHQGSTALHSASAAGHAKCVELLLAHGSDVNALTDIGMNALMLAATGGHTACVELLLRRGCDATVAFSSNRTTALSMSAALGHLPCVAALLPHDGASIDMALMGASALGHAAVVRYLIDQGGVGLDRLSNDFTPLMAAAYGGHVECVELLLKAGSDRSVQHKSGLTALALAQAVGQVACVQLLE